MLNLLPQVEATELNYQTTHEMFNNAQSESAALQAANTEVHKQLQNALTANEALQVAHDELITEARDHISALETEVSEARASRQATLDDVRPPQSLVRGC